MRDKAFKIQNKIQNHPKYDGYQRGLDSMVYKFLKKNLAEVVFTLNQIINFQMNFIGKLLENLRDKKFINLLGTIFGVLI